MRKSKKQKINCILDSHEGELHNLIAMLCHWGESRELRNIHIEIIYIGHLLSHEEILQQLNCLKKFCSYSFTKVSLVSPSLNIFIKIFNFIKLSILLFSSRKCLLRIVPYDQRKIFYFISNLGVSRVLANPHTTGSEVYTPGTFIERKPKFSKKFPVIVKEKLSKEYFNWLGYEDLVISGDYIHNESFLNSLTIEQSAVESEEKSICLFSLHQSSQLFTKESWIDTHNQILQAIKNSGLSSIYVKLHPSQPRSDYYHLEQLSKEIGLEMTLVSSPSYILAHQFDIFIAVLTSAGQHANTIGKPVCCYASNEMRDLVKEFGNDPYPYSVYSVPEITTKSDLLHWIKETMKVRYKKKEKETQKPLSLDGLLNFYEN